MQTEQVFEQAIPRETGLRIGNRYPNNSRITTKNASEGFSRIPSLAFYRMM